MLPEIFLSQPLFSLSLALPAIKIIFLYIFNRSTREQHTFSYFSYKIQAPERRCSSRTFRYGYLVTT